MRFFILCIHTYHLRLLLSRNALLSLLCAIFFSAIRWTELTAHEKSVEENVYSGHWMWECERMSLLKKAKKNGTSISEASASKVQCELNEMNSMKSEREIAESNEKYVQHTKETTQKYRP